MLKKILEYSPILYVILIFLGYINIHEFYAFFDIDIYKYISLSEIVLLFMPIIILVFIISIIILILYLTTNEGKYPTEPDTIKGSFSTLFIRKLWISDKGLVVSAIFFVLFLIDLIMQITIRAALIIGFFYLLRGIILKQRFIYEYYGFLVVLIVVFCAFFIFVIEYIIVEISKNIKNTWLINANRIIIVRFLIIYFTVNLFYNYSHSLSILQGHPYYSIEAKNNNFDLKTDDSLVFIGNTQNYLFLRDLRDSSNMILKFDDLSQFSIKKINRDLLRKENAPVIKDTEIKELPSETQSRQKDIPDSAGVGNGLPILQ